MMPALDVQPRVTGSATRSRTLTYVDARVAGTPGLTP
jgi:hypothetical protein